MKKLLIIFFVLFFCLKVIFSQVNSNHINVSGYYKSNGTYVQPYVRTAPNSTINDNFSTKGNTNPYTGKEGWIKPETSNYSYNNTNYNNSYEKTYNYQSNNNVYNDYDSKNGFKESYNNNNKKEYEFYLKNGLLEGPFKAFYDNGIVSIKGYFSNNKKSGELNQYHENGNLKKTEYYYNDLRNGNCKEYDENGNIIQESNYSNGVQNGSYFSYFLNGQIETSFNFTYGKLNGNFKSYYENGQLKSSGSFINDKKNGVFIVYNESGKIIDYRTFVNDDLNGPFKSYNENSTLNKTGFYLNGIESGLIKVYDENGNLSREFIIKNNLLNGSAKEYFENGKLKIVANYINDKKSGNFKEYDENGVLLLSYSMLSDEFNGLFTKYHKGKIEEKRTYINGKVNGNYIAYHYNDNDSIYGETNGYIIDNKEEGQWNTFFNKNGKKELAIFYTFKNGTKEGPFKDIRNDSVIFGNYSNGKLNGEYKLFLDPNKTFFGNIIETDSSKLRIATLGNYYNGKKYGYWKYYLFGLIINEGNYVNDKEEGEWKYYHINWADGNMKSFNIGGTLKSIENYKEGLLDGKAEYFSSIINYMALCDTNFYKKTNPIDSCSYSKFVKFYNCAYYKNNILHGPFIFKDSLGNILKKGNYVNGIKEGHWTEGNRIKDSLDTKIIYEEGNYIKGLREGKWSTYFKKEDIISESNYSANTLNGDYIIFSNNHIPYQLKKFEKNILRSICLFDSTGINVYKKYEIFNETKNDLKVRIIEYYKNRIASMEYFFKKNESVLNHEIFLGQLAFYLSKYASGEECYPDGKVLLTDDNNFTILSGSLIKKERIDKWKFNYLDQKVQINIDYSNDDPVIEYYSTINSENPYSGKFIFFDNENNVKQVRKIKKGVRNGDTVFYNKTTGKKIKKEKYSKGKLKN